MQYNFFLNEFVGVLKIIDKKAGSGSISPKHGSADPDPDPHRNVMVSQHSLAEGIPDPQRRPDGLVSGIV